MCGIIGFTQSGLQADKWTELLRKTTDTLAHRGPDDVGWWYDVEAGIGLGHRRLAIVDLSPLGHQPMVSASQRYYLTFNGEIYNFLELRVELEKSGHTFQGRSDTEVILAAVEQWGVDTSLKKFVGMFAFALWDCKDRVLILARDRLGEKPLYYGWQGDSFLFGSELKALHAHPAWQGNINRDALALFMRHNYIPAPYSIYQGIHKLLPGTFLSLPLTQVSPGTYPTPQPYWSAREITEAGIASPFQGSEAEAIAQLDSLLRTAIAGQMIADVPLGAFLSGGVDSSTIVALMQAQSDQPVKTFTIGFQEAEFNEAEYAKGVATHLGTDHTELYVTPQETMDVVPQLPTLYDEPFSDSSQIPTFLVSQLTRKKVTVSLSGDAGDELFGGYNRYFLGRQIWHRIGWIPKGFRAASAKALVIPSPQNWDTLHNFVRPAIPKRFQQRHWGDKLHKAADIIGVDTPDIMYRRLVSHWKTPDTLVLSAQEPPTRLTDHTQWANLADFTQRMMFLDMVSYLPDDILVKVDRASMGVSLESRVPLLDHRVVEFAWRTPLHMKIRNGQGKWLLRQVLYQYVPKKLIERPKKGFGIPIDRWLRGPLRDWADDLLDESRLRQEGFFDPAPIRKKWDEHLNNKRNWHYYLWDVLMFQAWYEKWC